MKLLLQQDDCAPDAGEWFWKEVWDWYGLEPKDFFDYGTNSHPNDTTMRWVARKFCLELSADDPYYKLYLLDAE